MPREILSGEEAKALYAELSVRQLAAIPIGVDRTPVDLVVLEREGKVIIGNAYGFLHPGWLYVDMLWVEESKRRQGLGSKLLGGLEEEAIRRGVHSAYLWTQDFEAPEFYREYGYETFVTFDNFIPNHTRIGMQKRLTKES